MEESPWPIVEPTATEPAVAAIWAIIPGWPLDAVVVGWAPACGGAAAGGAERAAGGAATVEAERVCAGAGMDREGIRVA